MAGETSNGFRPVRELHTPESSSESLIVIFFHGISLGNNDDYKNTWMTRTKDPKDSVCWPEMWLPEDLDSEKVRILSLTYDARLVGANDDVKEIGKNLVQTLVISCKNLWRVPIVLVGHSFGGLVIKSLVLEVDRRSTGRVLNLLDNEAIESCKKFMENLKGMVFYSVPHAGGTEKFTKFFELQCQKLSSVSKKDTAKSGILKNVKAYDRQMETLSTNFELALPMDIEIFACAEGLNVLVPYASAQRLSRKNHVRIDDADHKTVCMPSSRNCPSYSRMLVMLKLIMIENPVLQTHASSLQEELNLC